MLLYILWRNKAEKEHWYWSLYKAAEAGEGGGARGAVFTDIYIFVTYINSTVRFRKRRNSFLSPNIFRNGSRLTLTSLTPYFKCYLHYEFFKDDWLPWQRLSSLAFYKHHDGVQRRERNITSLGLLGTNGLEHSFVNKNLLGGEASATK